MVTETKWPNAQEIECNPNTWPHKPGRSGTSGSFQAAQSAMLDTGVGDPFQEMLGI